jgi:hypothetical protein
MIAASFAVMFPSLRRVDTFDQLKPVSLKPVSPASD